MNDVLSLLEIAVRNPLLIIAEDFDDYLLDTIITRKLTAGIKVCAIKTNVPPDLFIPADCLKAIVLENETFILKTRPLKKLGKQDLMRYYIQDHHIGRFQTRIGYFLF